MEADDAELGAAVERAQQGDEEAFAIAYRMVHPRLLGYVRGLVAGEAEDVTAEAWLEITRDLGRFRGDGAGFRGWTATIARHRALDHLRRQKRRPQTSPLEQDVLELPGVLDTEATALEGLGVKEVLAVIRKLPRDQAESVLLRVIVGLDGPAAARVLGKRPGAVRSAAHRGLRKLAGIMSPGGVDGTADNDGGARSLPTRKEEGGR